MWNVTHSSVTAENGVKHDTYGISKGGTVIKDISLDKQKIRDLVELLNKLDVSEVHALDVVEDFLGR